MTVFAPAGFSARRRAPQRQQQPERFLLNRQQQQQGTTEFQQGQVPVPPSAHTHADRPRHPSERAAHDGSQTGGHGGTPVRMPERSTVSPGEVKSYIREASVNVDA